MVLAIHPGPIRVPQDYSTIREAVDAANPGDIILVSAGSFLERGLKINKTLSIIGEGATNTEVEAFFEVYANNVTISGFTILYDFDYPVLISGCRGCNISNNIILGGYSSLYLYTSNDNIVAYNNMIPSIVYRGAIELFGSHNNLIIGNYGENGAAGISLTASNNKQ